MGYLNTKDVYDLFENGVAHLHVTDIDALPRVNVKEIPETGIGDLDEFMNNKRQVRCANCKYSRPIDRTKSPEKYFRDDCIVCECEDVVGDEPMVYPNEHYCSFGKVDDGC